jgi:hypothetical protein
MTLAMFYILLPNMKYLEDFKFLQAYLEIR